MKNIIFLLLTGINAAAQQKIYLAKEGELPYITIYKPAKNNSGTVVIICPGGAYAFRSDDKEGIDPAGKLADNGITGIVLDYRLPSTENLKGDYKTTFGDLQRAIHWVRQHAKELGIEQNQVGIMGFSAGGHLCATVGTHFKTDFTGELPNQNLRPDFEILAYAVISMADDLTHRGSRENILGQNPDKKEIEEFSNELQVTAQTPPTFITTALNDGLVPAKNSLYFAAALQQHYVPVELFIYADGGHAYGIHNSAANVQWIDSCIQWINNNFRNKR